MNILYVAEDISLPGFHGGSTHVQETINSLEELDHKVIVICKKITGQKKIEKKGKITYNRLDVPENGLAKNKFLFFNLGNEVKKVLNKNEIDLVWQRNRIFGNQAVIEGKKAGKITIIEMNEPIETSEKNFIFPLIKLWFIHSVNYADKVFGQHKCETKWVQPQEKKALFTNGSNTKTFNPKKINTQIATQLELSGKTIFYSGSFQEWHCLKNALIAFDQINKVDPKVKFILAGTGKQKKELELYVNKKNIRGVIFLGDIPLEKLAYYINASNVCLALFDRNFPTIKKYDYFYSPVKVFDYKACGKPIIASNIGNLKSLVKNNIHGISVNELKMQDIEMAMKKLIYNKKVGMRMGKTNLSELKSKYTWKKVTQKILTITLKQAGEEVQ